MESVASKAAQQREYYMGQIGELLEAATIQELRLTVEYLRRLERIHY